MKAVTSGLLSLLRTRQFYTVDLFEFTLVGGTVLRYAASTQNIYADGDVVTDPDVTLDADFVNYGDLYSAGGVEAGPYFERAGDKSKVRWRKGLEVDTLEFTVYPGTAQILGTSFAEAALIGVFDGAEFQLERAVMPTYGDTTLGTVSMFTGRVGEISVSRSGGIGFSIRSHLDILTGQLPKNLYQSGCIWTLYGTGCTLSASDFQQTGSLAAGSGQLVLNVTLPQATGRFDLGRITMTSGVCNGEMRSIRTYVKGTPGPMTLLSPLSAIPSTGDTFIAYFGCNKTRSVCDNVFGNLTHFRGFPFIPSPETAL